MRLRIRWVMIAIAFFALLALEFKLVFESGRNVVSGRYWRTQIPWENWEFFPFHHEEP